MILSDSDITMELDAGGLRIEPMADGALQPASIDLHLGAEFATWSHDGLLDPRQPQTMRHTVLGSPDGVFCLNPGGFALAATVETVTLPDFIAGRYEGKSSVARLGLASHITGAFVDPGFSGTITLELANLSGRAILLRPGMAIGQIAFTYLSSPAWKPYGPERGNHYQDQQRPTASRIHDQMLAAGLA